MYHRSGLITIVVVLASFPTFAHGQAVNFADANLKAAVEEALGVVNPTQSDMLGLTRLDKGFDGIVDLSGLEYATELEGLFLAGNEISDLSPISALTKLTRLRVQRNAIADISSLSGLTELRVFDIGDNPVKDLAVISNFSNLTHLYAGFTQFSDIGVLSDLTNLVALHLQRNAITDISALAQLTNLTDLSLADNSIHDISALSALTKLESLNLYVNDVVDISVLSNLPNLTFLDLNSNRPDSIEALSGLTKLTWLGLAGTWVDDISVLSALVDLETLNLFGNDISDISVLSSFAHLKWLELRFNQLADLNALVQLKQLQTLWVDGNPLAPNVCSEQIPQIEANNPGIDLTGAVCQEALPMTVAPEGTAFRRIQDAIDAFNPAADSTIMVADGVYSGPGNTNLDFQGKAIHLYSENGPGNCIINCQGSGRGFFIHSGEGPDTVVEGFTVTGGAAERGSAILCQGSTTPTLANCRIVGNGSNALWTGAELSISGTVEIESGNVEGGGIVQLSQGSQLRLSDCTVACNVTGVGGSVAIPAGSDVIFGGNAVTTFSALKISGRLYVRDAARFLFASIQIDDSALLSLSGNVVMTQNEILASSPGYLDIDNTSFNGSFAGNSIKLSLGSSQSGRALELRGLDQQGGGEPAAIGLDSIPSQNPATWTLERLELDADTALTLVSAQDNQAPFGQGRENEVLYVNELVLGDGAVLDVGAHRLYYDQDNLLLGQGAEILVNQVIPGRSLNLLDFDDPSEFINRIEASRPEAVELIRDDPLDPVGLMVVHSTTEPILVKGQFDPTRAGRLLVKFDYATGPDTQVAVYVSESPVLGSADRIAVDSFRGTGSQRLHVFESWVDVSTLDLSRGCWIELEVWVEQGQNQLQLLNEGRRLYGLGAGNDLWINDWLVEEHCDDAVCRDVTLDQAVRWEDFWVAKAAMGRYADLAGADAVSRCFEGAFCADGYVNKYDQFSMDWTVGYDNSFCGPLALTGDSLMLLQASTGPRRLSGLGDLNPPAGLMLLGKGSLSRSDADFKDYLYHLGTGQMEALPYDYTNVCLVSGLDTQAYTVSSEKGLIKLNGDPLLAPTRRSTADGTLSFGIDTQGAYPTGLPLLDACVSSEAIYVAPVVVNPDGDVPYVAAARLSLDGSTVEQLYHDAAWFNPEHFTKPDRYYGLREIELDDQGNLYVLSVYRVQGCTMLWQYDSQGAVLAKSSGEELGIEDPLALCYCPTDQAVYVGSGLLTAGGPNQSVVYQLAVEADGFGVARETVIPDMHHVTSMCTDAEGVLWVAGFSLTEEIPAKVYANTGVEYGPRLARIDLSRDSVESIDITGAVGDIGFPTSIAWVRE